MVLKRESKNVLAGIALVFGAIVIAVSVALYWSFTESFQKLDRIQVKNDSERAQRAYDDRFAAMEEKVAGWSYWNDLYDFIHGKKDSFPEIEMTESALGGIGIEFIAILADDRSVRAFRHLDAGKLLSDDSIPDFLQSEILWRQGSDTAAVRGIVNYRGLPSLIVSRPINDSAGVRPPKGRLLFVRQITPKFLSFFSEQILLSVALVPPRAEDNGGESLVFAADVGQYFIHLKSIDAQELGGLRVEIPREVSGFGRTSARAIIGAFVIVSGIVLTLFLVIFRLSGAENNFKSALRANEELRQREAHLKALIDSVPGYVSWFDSESRYLGVNQRLATDCGLSRADFIAKEVGFFSSQDLPDLKGRLRQFFSAKLTYQQQTVEFESATGKKRFVISMEKYNNGAAAVVVGLDMTATMESEMQAVRDRQAAIQASRLASLGEMAGGIAHEINNPLAIIQGISRRMARNLQGEPIYDKVKPGIQQIDEMTARIAAIIQGLKAISRDASLDPLAPVTLAFIIKQVKPLFLERYIASGIEMRAVVGDVETMIDCRQVQITQVLISLLQNSFEAIQECAERWVQIEIVTVDNIVELAVIDSGLGIKAAVAANMMDPFFSTKKVGKGVGLSLSVAQSLLAEHGGSLYYDEKAARTRFVLRLPMYLAPAMQATAA